MLKTAHQHQPKAVQPQDDVRPRQPTWQFIVGQGGIEEWIPELGCEDLQCPQICHPSTKAGAVGFDQVPRQRVAAAPVGDVEKALDGLVRKSDLAGNELVCPVEQHPGVP